MKNMKFFASVLALCPQAFCAMGSETVPPNVIYVFPDQFRNAALGVWQKPGFSNHVKFKGDPTRSGICGVNLCHEQLPLEQSSSWESSDGYVS